MNIARFFSTYLSTEVAKGRKFFLVIFSALLSALAQPNPVLPQGSMLIGCVALVPYLSVIYCEPSGTMRMRYGAIFGAIIVFFTYYWLIFFKNFSIWAIGGISLGYAGGYAIVANVLYRIRQRAGALAAPLLIALGWSALEYLRSISYLAFPWGLIALPATKPNNEFSLLLTQHIDITGIWLLSFVMACINAIVTEWVLRDSVIIIVRRQVLWVSATIVVLIAYGGVHLAYPPEVTDSVKMVLIQQNTDPWDSNREQTLIANTRLTLKALDELHQQGAEPSLVIWSETSMPYPYYENIQFYSQYPQGDPLLDILARSNWHLISGVPYREEENDRAQFYNGVIQLSPDGLLTQVYKKEQLIPFAEHIPFWEIPALQNFYANAIGLGGTWSIGRDNTLFETPLPLGTALTSGILICFEDSFGYLGRRARKNGAEVLINLTNNSWSRTNSAQVQHFASARLRSIENRVALVRSTNSGFTTVVDATGRTISELPMFEAGYLVVDVPLYHNEPLTLYSRYGDWCGHLLVLLTIIFYSLYWNKRANIIVD